MSSQRVKPASAQPASAQEVWRVAGINVKDRGELPIAHERGESLGASERAGNAGRQQHPLALQPGREWTWRLKCPLERKRLRLKLTPPFWFLPNSEKPSARLNLNRNPH